MQTDTTMQTPADRERLTAEAKARTEGRTAFSRKVNEARGAIVADEKTGFPRVMRKAVDFAAVTPEAHELAQARLREYKASSGSFSSAIRARSLTPTEQPSLSAVPDTVFDSDAIPTSAREEADRMRSVREAKVIGANDVPDMPVGLPTVAEWAR